MAVGGPNSGLQSFPLLRGLFKHGRGGGRVGKLARGQPIQVGTILRKRMVIRFDHRLKMVSTDLVAQGSTVLNGVLHLLAF